MAPSLLILTWKESVGVMASAEMPTARCGSREPPTGFQTRHFAISVIAPRSVLENPMEYPSPRRTLCWPTEKEVFGSEDRRPLSTGVPASRRSIPLKDSSPMQVMLG